MVTFIFVTIWRHYAKMSSSTNYNNLYDIYSYDIHCIFQWYTSSNIILQYISWNLHMFRNALAKMWVMNDCPGASEVPLRNIGKIIQHLSTAKDKLQILLPNIQYIGFFFFIYIYKYDSKLPVVSACVLAASSLLRRFDSDGCLICGGTVSRFSGSSKSSLAWVMKVSYSWKDRIHI